MAPTDPITTEFEKLFDALDTNHDNTLEWEDYHRLVNAFTHAYQLGSDDPRAVSLKVCYEMFWMELLRHANSDGYRVAKQEFVQALQATAVDTSRFNMVEGLPHALFDIADADGGNTLSKDEFLRFTKAIGGTEQRALQAFTQLDKDGDGVISRQDVIDSFREFMLNPGPDNTAGGAILGVL